MADRVLIEIITAANMAGVEQAKAGMLGLAPAALIAGAGIGILVAGGKAMVENAEKQEVANKSLAQAYAAMGEKVPTKEISQFIDQNARYIPSIYDVEEGYAALTRSGLTQTEVQKDMSRALDLAALKHITVGEAVDLLVKAEHGRMRGLIDLGITTAKYTDANGDLILAQHSVKSAMEELDPKLKDGRKTYSDLAQSSHELNTQWEKISNENGPALEGALAGVIGKTSDFLNLLRSSDWQGFNDTVVGLAGAWHGLTVKIDDATNAMENWLIKNGVTTAAGSQAGYGGKFGTNTAEIALRQRGFILRSN